MHKQQNKNVMLFTHYYYIINPVTVLSKASDFTISDSNFVSH